MLIYGKQSVYYLIERHKEKIRTLYIAKELDKKEFARLSRMGFELKRIPQKAAMAMSKSGNHQGFLAEVESKELLSPRDIMDDSFVVVLSALTDVGNIGAIIRSAYALGVDSLVITGIKNLNLEPIARSSSGALFDMRLVVRHNVHDLLNELKLGGFTLYGAVLDGVDVRSLHVSGKRALVLGSEGSGLSERIVNRLDKRVKIVMKNGFDSLNVSAAGAILIDRMRDG